MNNIKGFAVAQDGNMKRIAVTYDEIDDEGKVINANVKVNRVVTDNDVIANIDAILEYAGGII